MSEIICTNGCEAHRFDLSVLEADGTTTIYRGATVSGARWASKATASLTRLLASWARDDDTCPIIVSDHDHDVYVVARASNVTVIGHIPPTAFTGPLVGRRRSPNAGVQVSQPESAQLG